MSKYEIVVTETINRFIQVEAPTVAAAKLTALHLIETRSDERFLTTNPGHEVTGVYKLNEHTNNYKYVGPKGERG